MTEKRFSIWDCNSMENILNTFVQDKEKEGQENTLLTHKECCDLLNAFYEENKQLKQRISELELLNDGLNYALKNIRKIDVKIDVGDFE